METELMVPPMGLIVTTEASMWSILPDAYMRLPLDAMTRDTPSIDNRLADARWHDYRDIWLVENLEFRRLRILPMVGPENGYGIITGIIESMEPRHA